MPKHGGLPQRDDTGEGRRQRRTESRRRVRRTKMHDKLPQDAKRQSTAERRKEIKNGTRTMVRRPEELKPEYVTCIGQDELEEVMAKHEEWMRLWGGG